jgi:HAE1 family hydrophobic/amphiphilic exporter-1
MKIYDFAIKRPVTVAMIFLAMIVLGCYAYFHLGLDLMPDIEIPVVTVVTAYEGASPYEVEEEITKILEEHLATVSDLDKIESVSEEGISFIYLKFKWGVNLDAATNEARDKIDWAKRFLPEDADRPYIFKFSLTDIPVLVLAITAEQSYKDLYDLVDEKIADPLKTVPGVAAVTTRGGLRRQININLSLAELLSRKITPQEIIYRLSQENRDVPCGHLKWGIKDYILRVPFKFSLDEIGNILIRDKPPLLLKDIAQVEDGYKEQTQIIEIEDKAGLIVFIQKRAGQNTVSVVDRILEKLEQIKKDLPSDVNVTIARDFSDFIRRAIANLKVTLAVGGVSVMAILFFFLRTFRASLIVALSLPSSLMISFFLLYLGKRDLNIISLSSLVIALGLVVDGAIVVIDNIFRKREEGLDGFDSASAGVEEVAPAIFASVLTTVVVFIPIVFVGGISGIMFTEMALVVSFTLLASLLCAFTLIPTISARFLKESKYRNPSLLKIKNISEKLFTFLEDRYEGALEYALNHRKKIVISFLTIFFISLLFSPFIPKRFTPEADSGLFRVNLELPVGTRLEETGKVIEEMSEIIAKETAEERRVIFSMWGASTDARMRMVMGEEGSHLGFVGVRLKLRKERERSVFEYVEVLREKFKDRFPAAKIRFNTEDPLIGIMFGQGKPFVLEIYGEDLEIASELSKQILRELKKVGSLVDIDISRKQGKPEIRMIVDRDKLKELGLDTAKFATTLRGYLHGITATKYGEKGKEYDVRLRLREEERDSLQDLKQIYFKTDKGSLVQLQDFTRLVSGTGPVKIERIDQRRVVKISANLRGSNLSRAVKKAEQVLKNIVFPKGFYYNFGGESEEQYEAFLRLGLAFIMGALLVYMVLASQFESLVDPLVIFFSVPFAFVGVILISFITRVEFTIDSFIGAILLLGIVVNNAIVLISYTKLLEDKGIELERAVKLAGKRRLRPILMTTLTTLAGIFPLVILGGEGSEYWRPFGLTILGGLSISAFITLILVPILYYIFNKRYSN